MLKLRSDKLGRKSPWLGIVESCELVSVAVKNFKEFKAKEKKSKS